MNGTWPTVQPRNVAVSPTGMRVIDLEVVDHLVISDPDGARFAAEKMALLLDLVALHGPARTTEVPEISGSFYGMSAALAHWRTMIPSAAALHPLYNPIGSFADGSPIDATAATMFTHTLDGRGIRSRGAVLAWLLSEMPRSVTQGPWLSLACGAGRPVCRALAAVQNGEHTELTVLDRDAAALELVSVTAREEGASPSNLRLVEADVLDAGQVDRAVVRGSCAVVECLGFFEYLPTVAAEGWVSASDFLRLAYSRLRPGGVLAFANMRDTHPELPFTLHAVRWPYIVPRSIDEVARLVADAGIDPSGMEVWLPDDGVYAVYTLRAPATG